MTYALLKNPAHTRVSFTDSDILAVNELMILTQDLGTNEIRPAEIGGVTYVLFDCAMPLDDSAIRTLSRLSFVYAIFELHGELQKPVAINADYFIDQELSGILKYSGKTNELFTRLMLNLAQFYMKNPPEILNILDPLAGKGTTLFEALMQGHNAYGVEVDAKVVHESVVYLKKYLETAKYKHENHTEKISGQSATGKFTSTRNQITIARNKQEEKQGIIRHFEILDGDTRNVSALFKKNHFHAIVADLPYGVQHGSKTGTGKKPKPQSGAITRNALSLVAEAMPGWVRVLKPGGVIVLAWNLFLITRVEMAELLMEHGFTVPDIGVNFSHRVDQAIDRDLIVGVLG